MEGARGAMGVSGGGAAAKERGVDTRG
jgi:hypothetical protein